MSNFFRVAGAALKLKGADGTTIGNTGDRLNVDVSLSPKVSCVTQFSDTTLSSTWTTIDSHTGSGAVRDLHVHFENDNASIRITIDGVSLFDFDTIANTVNRLDWMKGVAANTGVSLPFLWTANGVFHWIPPGGAGFTTDYKVEVRSTAGKKLHNYIICTRKD